MCPKWQMQKNKIESEVFTSKSCHCLKSAEPSDEVGYTVLEISNRLPDIPYTI